MLLPLTGVLEERGDPLTKWVIYKEWLVYKLIKLILSQSYFRAFEIYFWYRLRARSGMMPSEVVELWTLQLSYQSIAACFAFFYSPDSTQLLWRVTLSSFNRFTLTLHSLSIFDGLVVSFKVSLSYYKQVANLSLKTCIEVLTVKDLVRTMSELCQCDRLWTLYMFLPCNPTLETSPLGMVIGLPKIVVA